MTDNIQTAKYPILFPTSKVDVIICTEPSTKGLGAVKDTENIGGRWSEEEARFHINSLELMATKNIFWTFNHFAKMRNASFFRYIRITQQL